MKEDKWQDKVIIQEARLEGNVATNSATLPWPVTDVGEKIIWI